MSISQMDLSLFSPSFELSTSFFANVSLSLPLPLSLSCLALFFFAPLSSVRVAMEAVHHRCLFLYSRSLPFLLYTLSSAFLSLLFPFVRLASSSAFLPLLPSAPRCVVSFCQPLSQSILSVIVCFPPRWKKPHVRRFNSREREPPLTRGRPSRNPRRFKLLMSIFRLVRLSELVHRRRCVLPIKVFNESGRKMAPARPR